jgi:hypothetical protein
MFKNPKPQTHHRLLSLLSQSIVLAIAWKHFKVKQAIAIVIFFFFLVCFRRRQQ